MNGTNTSWSGAVSRARSIAVVGAIVMASLVGLHDWADGAATHDVAVSDGKIQDTPAA